MTWNDDLKQAVPRDEIPAFLADLQALVAALREDRAWELTPPLRQHGELVLEYLQEGDKKEAVRAALKPVG